MSCETGFNLIQSMLIVLISLLINGLAAAIIVQYILRLIYKNVVDVPLIPLPHREKRTPPAGFTPVEPGLWEHEPRGEGVGYWDAAGEYGDQDND